MRAVVVLPFLLFASACGSSAPQLPSSGRALDEKPVPRTQLGNGDDGRPLWEITGAEFDEVTRAWKAVQAYEQDSSVGEFQIRYRRGPTGETIVGFFRPRSISEGPGNLVTIVGRARGYSVYVEGAAVTVFPQE